MDIKNIYIINGDINEFGIYEDKPEIYAYIAECEIGDNEEQPYYFAFKNYNKTFNVETEKEIVKVKAIMNILNNAREIEISKEELEQKMPQEEIEKLKSRILKKIHLSNFQEMSFFSIKKGK